MAFENKIRKGFTLAEILITLSIIGVIASITIPSLVQDIESQLAQTSWKKAYADLSQAYTLVRREENVSPYFTCTTEYCTKPLAVKVINKFLTVRDMQLAWGSIINISHYKSITGVPFEGPILHQAYILNNFTIYFWSYYPKEASIWVDVNGYKRGPNILGKDLFAVYLAKDRIRPYGANGTGVGVDYCEGVGSGFPSSVQSVSPTMYAGIGCSAKYLYK